MFPNKSDPPRLKVINLWAGPGAGKSTTAAGLFNLMKIKDYKVELVTEWAKDATYDHRQATLAGNQLYVFAKQEARLRRLVGQVDIAITDSPLPLSLIYAPHAKPYFKDAVLGFWREYENLDVLVKRTKVYQGFGRSQTEGEARKIDILVEDLLLKLVPNHIRLPGDERAPHHLLDVLEQGMRIIEPQVTR